MGQPILTYPLGNNIDAGIRQSVPDGFIGEYEARETARFSLVSWTDWLLLDEDARAKCVAHYRLHNAIEANVVDAQNKYHERQARRRRSGR